MAKLRMRIPQAGLLMIVCTISVVAQDKPSLPPNQETELNTVLMESTFRIEGRTAQNQPTTGTSFVMGRPFPNEPSKGRYVLITAAHVLDDMQNDVAMLYLRKKVDETNWVRMPYQIQIRANGRPLWTKHPDADVAVMYINVPDISLPLLSTDLLADDKMLSQYRIHPGDTLECLGYPFGIDLTGDFCTR